MKSLYIQPTKNSPEINFDVDRREFVISGRSIQTNPQKFYDEVISWLEEYAENKPKELNVRFSLNYYNLASAKRFMFMIYLFSQMKIKGCSINIEWRFVEDDEFMREFGEDLSKNFDLPFILVPQKESQDDIALAG
jgi:hypothetical protein